jgi:glucose/arabinose dehydrogenase
VPVPPLTGARKAPFPAASRPDHRQSSPREDPRPRRRIAITLAIALVGSTLGSFLPPLAHRAAAVDYVAPGFQVTTLYSGLNLPTAVAFAGDGRVFVTEYSGIIKAYDSIADSSPTVVADLSANVHAIGDRGMLGLAVDPGFTTGRPYLYLSYVLDAPPGGTAPFYNDGCPNGPAAGGEDACPAPGRLTRIQVGADSRMVGAEHVLIGDSFWCFQASPHAIDHVAFGPDGALYVSAGDGAVPAVTDYGQQTGPTANACGDPPLPVGQTLTLPAAEGGSLRAQDLRTSADPAGGGGAIVRVSPDTGAAMPDNPLVGNGVPTDDRHIAYGLRNPFRFTFRPGTSEIWISDVGWSAWEELNRIVSPTDATVENFGWPCYEGAPRQAQWDNVNVNLCEQLYASPAGTVTAPYWAYRHFSQSPDVGRCANLPGTSIAGIAFSEGAPFPAAYDGALFVSDYARGCIWALPAGAGGLPDPASLETIVSGINPVDLEIGPDGRLYYVDLVAGSVHRVSYSGGNEPPVARATATPDSGPLPLSVAFDASATTDDGPLSELTFEWDLDGNGNYTDATGVSTSKTYTSAGPVDVGLRVTDLGGESSTLVVPIQPGNTRPTASILAPSTLDLWASGGEILFSGTASDDEDGTLGASAMRWTITLYHCITAVDCHAHPQSERIGVDGGSYFAPSHSYPAYLEFKLTVTDTGGLTDTETIRMDPRTVELSFETSPAGLELLAGEAQGAAPLPLTAIVGSSLSVSAPTPQSMGGITYDFTGWSDGGAASHDVVAGSVNATYTATYQARTSTGAALLVVGNPSALIAGDAAVRTRLQGLGYTVTIVDDSASTASSATGQDLVIISSSVLASNVNTKFRNVTVPVIVWEHALFDDLAMTASGGTKLTAQTSLVITTPAHPLAAGLSGTVAVATTAGDFASGSPNSNAVVIATVPGTTAAGIFAYELGASMPGRAAPARRVALFMGDATPSIFTTAGQSLFDAAIQWADGDAGPPPPPPTGGAAVLVVGNPAALIAGDTAVRTRLAGLGYTVTIVDDSASTAASAVNQDLVVISSSSAAKSVNTKFRNVTVPIVVWEHALFDDLGMTSAAGTARASQVSLVIASPGHPLAAGLTGTVQVATTAGKFASGTPGPNAVVVATIPGTTAAGIFAYELGVTMPGLAAPARRVALFMSDATPSIFTSAGWSLFDAAIQWADG